MQGDTGPIPGQGTKIPHALEQSSPQAATREKPLPSAMKIWYAATKTNTAKKREKVSDPEGPIRKFYHILKVAKKVELKCFHHHNKIW